MPAEAICEVEVERCSESRRMRHNFVVDEASSTISTRSCSNRAVW